MPQKHAPASIRPRGEPLGVVIHVIVYMMTLPITLVAFDVLMIVPSDIGLLLLAASPAFFFLIISLIEAIMLLFSQRWVRTWVVYSLAAFCTAAVLAISVAALAEKYYVDVNTASVVNWIQCSAIFSLSHYLVLRRYFRLAWLWIIALCGYGAAIGVLSNSPIFSALILQNGTILLGLFTGLTIGAALSLIQR